MGRTRGGRRTTAVYTIRVDRFFFGAWGCFRGQVPILGIFFLFHLGIWHIGMGIGGAVDRPTDTLPHGVLGVGPLIERSLRVSGLVFFCCCLWVHQRSLVLYFKAIAFAGSSSRNVGSGHHFYKDVLW